MAARVALITSDVRLPAVASHRSDPARPGASSRPVLEHEWKAIEFPSDRPVRWLAIVGCGALVGLAALAITAVVTARHDAEVGSWAKVGRPAVATISARDDTDFDIAVDVELTEEPGRVFEMFAPADFPDEYRDGDRYPAVVKADATRVRLLAEPYDPIEPVVWAALPTAVLAWYLARRSLGA